VTWSQSLAICFRTVLEGTLLARDCAADCLLAVVRPRLRLVRVLRAFRARLFCDFFLRFVCAIRTKPPSTTWKTYLPIRTKSGPPVVQQSACYRQEQ